jgi:monooxygenase
MSLADGPSIKKYIEDTAAEFGIDKHIQFDSKVVTADFDTASSTWTLTLADGRKITARFMYSCAGYYDYDEAVPPGLPGDGRLRGNDRPPAVLARGPRLPRTNGWWSSAPVRPLSRSSPPWPPRLPTSQCSSAPPRGSARCRARTRSRTSPAGICRTRAAHRFIRAKNIGLSTAFYRYTRRFPKSASKLLRGMAVKQLGDERLVDEHFTPTYNVWDERVCVAPNGDLFHDHHLGQGGRGDRADRPLRPGRDPAGIRRGPAGRHHRHRHRPQTAAQRWRRADRRRHSRSTFPGSSSCSAR